MQKGDFVSIRYNEFLTKAATVKEVTENDIRFFDREGEFVLSNDYIERAGIVITVLQDVK